MVKMVIPRITPSRNSEKREVKQTRATKESWCHWRFWCGKQRSQLAKAGELCTKSPLTGVIFYKKPFLTLGWKSRAERCIFDLKYLLPNANFKRKTVINRYLRCLFAPPPQKKREWFKYWDHPVAAVEGNLSSNHVSLMSNRSQTKQHSSR